MAIQQPPGPGAREAAAYDEDRLGFLAGIAHRYGDVVRFDDRTWVVNDPVAAARIMRDPEHQVTKTRDHLHRKANVGGETELERRLRREMPDLLNRHHAGGRLHRMRERVAAAVSGLPAGPPVDIVAFGRELSLRLVADACLGDRGGTVVEPAHRLLDALLDRVDRDSGLPLWVPTAVNRAIRGGQRDLAAAVTAAVEAGLDPDGTVAGHITRLGAESGLAIDWVSALTLASQQPAAGALSWAVHRLSTHPQWSARIRAEAASGLDGGDVTRSLPVTVAVLHEAIRLNPPTWLYRRKVESELELCGYRAPVGQALYMCGWVLHRDERAFAQPERFDPDRWLDPATRRTAAQGFFGFGRGAGRCPGASLATTYLALVLAALISQRDVEAVHPERVVPDVRRTMLPVGLEVRLPRHR